MERIERIFVSVLESIVDQPSQKQHCLLHIFSELVKENDK